MSAAERRPLDVGRVESAIRGLLVGYADAFRFVWGMPILGRARVTWPEHTSERWGSRLLTRVYLETHVRKQLQAIQSCLWLELLASAPGERRARIASLQAELEAALVPLVGWRRVFSLATRVPTVAASLPVISAFVALPLGGTVSSEDAFHAAAVLLGTALAIWIVFVWPSIRLGFRLKRAVLSGGCDMRHPLLFEPGKLRWEGFKTRNGQERGSGSGDLVFEAIALVARTARSVRRVGRREARAPAKLSAFPGTNVYAAENEVFRVLDRPKPPEVPIDLLLAFGPYLLLVAFLGGAILAAITAVSEGVSDVAHLIALILVLVVGVLGPPQVVLQARRNYRRREH